MSATGTGTPTRRPGVLLAVILVTQLMVILDATVVNIAMPKIQHALDFSPSSLSWVQNAYALAFGGLLLLGARAGDLLGRRRVFITGVSVFTLASLLGGLAPNAELLLTARVLQGIGGAIAAPAALTLMMLTYREGPERVKALGYYSLVSSGGGSVGLVLGGMLTDWVSWRWGLFINVPIGIALVVAARKVLTETAPEKGRFDIAGALTSTLGITSLVYGFIRVAEIGWTAGEVLAAFGAGAVLLVSFVLIERRVSHPIVPLRLFRSAPRSAAFLTMLLVIGTMMGMFFFLTQYLQGVLLLSPLAAGLAFLPMTGLLFAASRFVPRLVARIDGGKLMLSGSLLITAGTAWLTQLDERSTYLADVVGPMVLFGLGAGVLFIPLVGRAITGVAPEDSGAASGLLNVVQQVGGALGLGVLVTVFGTASRDSTGTTPREVLTDGVHGALLGSLVYAVLSLAMIVITVRPWTWLGRKTEPTPAEQPVVVDSHF
ncbi:MFS transporter [Kribbella sandramycini]|uniref:EmrB/QacA subfamily drug resistance transporter n=1 Tax=Kribbella sandramycini TaxID=60450 RepID=A0A7Y4L613_9ACTN|nr:MFS transporter [Kribbella sandramycini]MBB6566059.1 EmrB/QacA subfamily drug resistance transporter [Kribbella sandramycini]NOL45060.1 MFS transporter [Kribbella sandramycini]